MYGDYSDEFVSLNKKDFALNSDEKALTPYSSEPGLIERKTQKIIDERQQEITKRGNENLYHTTALATDNKHVQLEHNNPIENNPIYPKEQNKHEANKQAEVITHENHEKKKGDDEISR